jgi:hypothetical protein
MDMPPPPLTPQHMANGQAQQQQQPPQGLLPGQQMNQGQQQQMQGPQNPNPCNNPNANPNPCNNAANANANATQNPSPSPPPNGQRKFVFPYFKLALQIIQSSSLGRFSFQSSELGNIFFFFTFHLQ